VTIISLGQFSIGKVFDVVSHGSDIYGSVVDPIEVEMTGGLKLNVNITVGYGQNPNTITYGIAGEAPSNQCE
jgi:hypothetical protein